MSKGKKLILITKILNMKDKYLENIFQEAHELSKLGVGVRNYREPVRRESKKIGRNEPCGCGSGLKNKKCCRTK